MGFGSRRTGTVIAHLVKIVHSLFGAIRQVMILLDSFRERMDVRRNVPDRPMIPVPGGSVRIVHQQREAFSFRGSACPRKIWGTIGSVTGELLRNIAAIRKAIASQRQAHGTRFLLCVKWKDKQVTECQRDRQ